MSKVKCIYHKNCSDGLAAAAVVKKMYPEMTEEDFFPMHYGDMLNPNLQDGKFLYIVDFSLPPETLEKLAENWEHITVLDHHESAVRKYENRVPPPNVNLVFDMKKSGARLAWDHFFTSNPPMSILMVEDRDLWVWNYEDTRAFAAALRLGAQTVLSYFSMLFERKTGMMIKAGAAIVKYENLQVRKAKADKIIDLQGYSVPIVNTTVLISEIGEKLCKNQPFAVMFFYRGNEVILSFRSDKNGINVAKVAERFGGGGHEHAAGATVSVATFNVIYKGRH